MSPTNSFPNWQADYAAHNIPTIPVEFVRDGNQIRKKPMVGNAGRFGLGGSNKIASKFAGAPGIGFMCGRRSGITVLDWDSQDERGFVAALDRHGATPLVARTASGKLHAYYRHNGERRWIRPRRDVPIDILGGGLNVAPPSRIETDQYQFIQGSLDDVARLPVLRNLAQGLSADAVPTDWGSMREGDGRNNAFFRLLGRAAHHCDDFDQLFDYATTRNAELGEPMEPAEVVKVAQSVWKMQVEGRNRFGQHGAWVPVQLSRKLASYPNTYTLYGVLRAENGPHSIFPIANAMAPKLGIGRKSFAQARRHLLEEQLVEQVSPDTQHHAALYRWPLPRGLGEIGGGVS